MSEPFIGQIIMFGGNFAIRNWAFCDGQLLAVSQNDALFSLLGTIYGGDGRTTFGLPDLRGRVPIHQGSGPGLSPRTLGTAGGTEDVTITTNQLPSHTHALQVTSGTGHAADAQGNLPAQSPSIDLYVEGEFPDTNLSSSSIANRGGSQQHTNIAPYLCVNFIIALS